MASLISVLARLLLVGAFVLFGIAAALAENDRVEAMREWSTLAGTRTDFEVSDPALVPSRLTSAAKLARCNIDEGIGISPVRFTKLKSHRLAVVYCHSIMGKHIVFDLSTLHRPRLISFPSIQLPEGFGTTDRPGWLTWDKESLIFQAITGSDMKPSWETRQSYRFDDFLDFVIIRVEIKGMPGYEEWTTFWEAPRWTLPEVKQQIWEAPPWTKGPEIRH